MEAKDFSIIERGFSHYQCGKRPLFEALTETHRSLRLLQLD